MACLKFGCCFFLFFALATVNGLPHWYTQFTAARPHDQSSIRVCGRDAEEFMHWFCRDPSFRLPYPHHLGPVIRTNPEILGNRAADPFHYQAVKCCRHSCNAKEFKWMCTYHKKHSTCRQTHSNAICHNKVIVEMVSQK